MVYVCFVYYEKAAQQGDRAAQFNTRVRYRDGLGCGQSDERAAEWFEKSVVRGYVEAQHALGFLYEHGRGVPQNDELPRETLMDRTALRFATVTVSDANRATSGLSSCTGRVRNRGTSMRSTTSRSVQLV